MTARLLARGVERRFGATIALAGVDLEIRRGEIHALLGENGAGKSTLMKVLSGAVRMDRGSLTLDGEDYAPRDPADARRQGVAMIYQELALAPHLSVAENVLLGIEPRRLGLLDRRRRDRIASLALAKVGRSELPLNLRVARLSMADRQLVEIARSVAVGARLLVLDEPTSSLGEADTEHLFALCRALREEGCSIIYISHFLDEIRRLADRVTVLRDGRTIATHEVSAVDDASLIADMVGRTVEHLHERGTRVRGEVLLKVEGLSGNPQPIEASLEVRRGEVVGIAGLVGSGRTEFLRTLMGLDSRSRGSVTFRGRPAPRTPHDCWRAGIGMVCEDRKLEGLARSSSIAENVALPRLPPRPTTRRLRDVARGHVTA
ncbi:MAG: sugar ABC transporter ATP-binding protein, partial [Planctomycetota bacterium]